jgi:hypothetical protein
MSTNAIQSISNIDINKVSFSDVRANKAGGKSISIRYNNVPLQIRLPKLTYSGGMKSKVNKQGITEYSLKFFLKGCDPNAKERAPAELGEMATIYNFLFDLRQKVFEHALKNSVKIWNKTRTEEGLQENYNLFLKPSVKLVDGQWTPDNKYPPSLTMKVPIYNNEISMSVANAQGKPVEITLDNMMSHFPKYVGASIVVTPNIYVSGNSFGVSWKINFARVTPPSKLSAVDVFADEIEEDAPNDEESGGRNLQNEFEAEYQRMKQEVQPEEEHIEEVTKPIVKEEPVNIPAPTKTNRRRQQAV